MRLARRVRDLTLDNRMASLPGGFWDLLHAAGDMSSKNVVMKRSRPRMVDGCVPLSREKEKCGFLKRAT